MSLESYVLLKHFGAVWEFKKFFYVCIFSLVFTNNTLRRCFMSNSWRPGEVAPESGNYAAYDAEGKCGGSCYLEKGQRFPATQHSGSYYMKED